MRRAASFNKGYPGSKWWTIDDRWCVTIDFIIGRHDIRAPAGTV